VIWDILEEGKLSKRSKRKFGYCPKIIVELSTSQELAGKVLDLLEDFPYLSESKDRVDFYYLFSNYLAMPLFLNRKYYLYS
jgi:hypothetical protein